MITLTLFRATILPDTRWAAIRRFTGDVANSKLIVTAWTKWALANGATIRIEQSL